MRLTVYLSPSIPLVFNRLKMTCPSLSKRTSWRASV